MTPSAKDYNELLAEFIRGPEGRKVISRATKTNYLSTMFNKREYMAVAEELKHTVINAYLAQVKTPDSKAAYFNRDAVVVMYKPDKKAEKLGKVVFEIVFNGDALYRPSLYWDTGKEGERGRYRGGHLKSSNDAGYSTRSGASAHGSGSHWQDGHFTGSGVYDIIGLFTNGWGDDTTPTVYGTWLDPETEEEWRNHTKSRNRKSGNPFIKHAIRQFKLRHPYVEVEFPALWGGTLPPRGNWKSGARKT